MDMRVGLNRISKEQGFSSPLKRPNVLNKRSRVVKDEIEIINAVIESVSIDTERCLSAWLTLDYGGTGQGFGGYALFMRPFDTEKKAKGTYLLGNYAGLFIYRCIEIGGVEKWEQLRGRTIRVKKPAGFGGSIIAIGHIVKDDWFEPTREFEHIRELIDKGTATAAELNPSSEPTP